MKPLPPVFRLPLLLLGMLALVSGILAGLARLAVAVPDFAATQAGQHGALMVTAFLGTVITLERAVALATSGANWPYLAPLCAGLGGLSLLLGLPVFAAQGLFIAASGLLCAGSVLLWRRQPTLHLATLALGGLSWLAGNLAWLAGGVIPSAVPGWIAFLVLTIAAERLELTRFLPRAPVAEKVFIALVACLLLATGMAPLAGDALLPWFAATLCGLALWLLRQDIARHTVRQTGLTRYIACCLLLGYGWLLLAGVLGMTGGFVPGSPLRDAALHAVFLGFVFSMIFGHAPIIFPAIVKVKIDYRPALYLPLILLHVSLLARVAGDLSGSEVLVRQAASANALSLLVFVLTLLTGVSRQRPALH